MGSLRLARFTGRGPLRCIGTFQRPSGPGRCALQRTVHPLADNETVVEGPIGDEPPVAIGCLEARQ